MMVHEKTPVSDDALPVARFRAHLRLGSGFGDDGLQDELLSGFLRAALAAVEGRTGKALVSREFVATVYRWSNTNAHYLSPAPVASVADVVIEDAHGEVTPFDGWTLRQDSQSPKLVALGGAFPVIPQGGSGKIEFTAGYGVDFDDVPADLAQAVLLLAAHYYEYRDETSLSSGCMPFGVTALIDRYRPIRLTAGGAA